MAQAADEASCRKLLKKHRIYFDSNKRRAPGHEELFETIKKLGEYDFGKYHSDINFESSQKPWRQNTLSRAKSISARAQRCLEMNKNESSWRLSLESEILRRFSVEIVWSEIEVSLNSTDGSLDSLADRQKARKPCQCPSRVLGDEGSGGGMNQIFDDRAEEDIQHDSEIKSILKTGRKPDRVIGLNVTPRLDRILNRTEGTQGYPIGDSITTCPFKDDNAPLLFPFLVLEAKSEKSSDPFSKINLQTGFAIYALLKLQRNLIYASIDNRQASLRPLVWFLSNKGEIWRLSGAYVEETEAESQPNFRILELWEGNIRYEEQALRLLLIIDHIFDWARDAYRKDIIDNLCSLAANPTPSLVEDSDVVSIMGRFLDSDNVSISESTSDNFLEQTQNFGVPQLLKVFDTHKVAIRDARNICYRFCAFYVTLENLDKFYYSVRSMREAKQLARRLWKGIVGPNTWSVTADCLNAVERLWTYQDRQLQTFQNPEEPFLACFEIKSYFSNGLDQSLHSDERNGQWNQIHQLTYIAIAHDALKRLREKTQFTTVHMRMRFENCPEVPQERVINMLEPIRFAPITQSFAAAVSRARLCSFASKTSRKQQHVCKAVSGLKYFEPSIIQNNSVKFNAAELPWMMYKHLKVGMREPSENFLRVSKQIIEYNMGESPPEHGSGWVDWDSKLKNFNCMLVADVDERDVATERNLDTYCLFVFEWPSMSANHEIDRAIKIDIYPKTLVTYLDGSNNQKYNLSYKTLSPRNEFRVVLKALKRTWKQYQEVLLFNEGDSEDKLYHVGINKEILSTWEKAKGPHSFRELVDNIKIRGETSNLSLTLRCLIGSFNKVSQEG